jgi:hypothetical protein
MANYFKKSYYFIHRVFFDDLVDRYLLAAGIIIFFTDFLIWRSYLATPDIYVFLRIDIYPIKFLAIVMGLNFLLSATAHDKEKEVGYLLLLGNVILAILIFVLEIFYLTHS